MKRNVSHLTNRVFDLLIIGGGITGACLAHDAALRGWSVALVEKGDFGAFTSSASSKLLHGGIRYLPTGQFWKVRESAAERTVFQIIAPHLTRYVPFVIPTFDSGIMKSRAAMMMGMALYESLCAGLNGRIADPAKQVPHSRFMHRSRVIRDIPQLAGLTGLTGAYVLPESHMHNSERMTLAFVKTAAAHGAVVANHVCADTLLEKNDRVSGITARDQITGDSFGIRAKMTANASGPFIPGLNGQIHRLRLKKQASAFSKGVHIVTRSIHPHHAITLTTNKKIQGLINRGGRHIFIIPWRGCSLIGTTDVPYHHGIDQVQPTEPDILDFLKDINDCLPSADLKPSDVRFSWAGLYPLIASEIKPDTYQGTGEYQVVDHGRYDGVEGIVTVLGAKYTTGRKVAQQAADLIEKKLKKPHSPCRTHQIPLIGGDIEDWHAFSQDCVASYRHKLAPDMIDNMVMQVGREIPAVMALCDENPALMQRVSAIRPTIAAEIVFAVQTEMAVRLRDVIFGRTGMGTIGHPGDLAIERAAEIMADLLDWTTERKTDEIADVSRQYDVMREISG